MEVGIGGKEFKEIMGLGLGGEEWYDSGRGRRGNGNELLVWVGGAREMEWNM